MRITGKILLYILTASLILFSASIGFVSVNFRKVAKANAERIVEQEARVYANGFKSSLDVDLTLTRSLASTFQDYKKIPYALRLEVYNSIQRNMLIANPQIQSIATSWEFAKFDSMFIRRTNRFLNGFYRDGGKIRFIERQHESDTASMYHKLKVSKSELFIAQQENYTNRPKDTIFVASIASPIIADGEFVGLANIDVALERFSKQIEKISPFPSTKAFLLSNDSRFIAHSDSGFMFKHSDSFFVEKNVNEMLKQHVLKGKAKAIRFMLPTDEGSDEYYAFIAPIHLSGMLKPWSVGIAVPYNVVLEEANNNFFISLSIGVLAMLLLTIITWYYARQIILPLRDTTNVVSELATGAIDTIEPLEVTTKDEIGQIRHSVNILLEALKGTANFAKEIGEGNFEAQFSKMGDKDVLGTALLEMRENLRKAEDEDNKRIIEELKLNWTTEGLAKFSEILRSNHDNVEKLAYNLISGLVKHIKAVQGGFFRVLHDNDEGMIELSAFYAFEGEIHRKKTFAMGEGVVGEVIKKNEFVRLNNVPNSYIEVVSGLGRANPRDVLVTPISLEGKVYGAIEIASFKEYEDFQVEFVKRLCESIAGTLEAIISNNQTKKLLEESRLQKDQLELHEKQLMENIKEMKDVQKSTAKREAELSSVLRALHNLVPVAEYDMQGQVIFANKLLLDLLNIKMDDLLGRKQGSMRQSEAAESFENFWEELRQGKTKKDIQHYIIGEDRELWFEEDYTPIVDEHGKPYKVLNIVTDITPRVILERELERRGDNE